MALRTGRLARYLLGRDVFVSYARSDATVFAGALASALDARGLSVFIDQSGTPPNGRVPAEVLRAARRCAVMALVASPAGCASAAVLEEVTAFSRGGRPVVPIAFAEDGRDREAVDAVRGTRLGALVEGLAVSTERPRALAEGEVPDALVRRLELAVGVNRQSRRLRRAATLAISTLLALIAASAAVSVRLGASVRELRAARESLAEAKSRFAAQEEQASRRLREQDQLLGERARQIAEADQQLASTRREAQDWAARARRESARFSEQLATSGKLWVLLDPLLGEMSSVGSWSCVDGKLRDCTARLVITPSWERSPVIARAWSPNARRILSAVAQGYAQCHGGQANGPRIVVSGHFSGLQIADPSYCHGCTPFDLFRGTTTGYAADTSMEYAKAVAAELVALGIPAERLNLVGFGDERPLVRPASSTTVDVTDERQRSELVNNRVEVACQEAP